MSLAKRILNEHPEFIDVYNDFSPILQNEVAQEISQKRGSPTDPNSLPTVTFVDNERTREQLPKLAPWSTPYVTKARRTPFGGEVVAVEIHPNAIIQRAEDIHRTLSRQTVKDYISKHEIGVVTMAQHLLDQSAAQIMTEAMMINESSDVNPIDIYSVANNRGLDKRDAGK